MSDAVIRRERESEALLIFVVELENHPVCATKERDHLLIDAATPPEKEDYCAN
jgi:hypothetical protein